MKLFTLENFISFVANSLALLVMFTCKSRRQKQKEVAMCNKIIKGVVKLTLRITTLSVSKMSTSELQAVNHLLVSSITAVKAELDSRGGTSHVTTSI